MSASNVCFVFWPSFAGLPRLFLCEALSIEWQISWKETNEFYWSINQETVLLWLINIHVSLKYNDYLNAVENREKREQMPTILVADDDANIRELVCLFLRNDGFETAEAADGKEALAVYNSTNVDLVILDIMMPIMDGWTLSKELRRANPDLPLLMLTARGETWEKVKGFELGTDD